MSPKEFFSTLLAALTLPLAVLAFYLLLGARGSGVIILFGLMIVSSLVLHFGEKWQQRKQRKRAQSLENSVNSSPSQLNTPKPTGGYNAKTGKFDGGKHTTDDEWDGGTPGTWSHDTPGAGAVKPTVSQSDAEPLAKPTVTTGTSDVAPVSLAQVPTPFTAEAKTEAKHTRNKQPSEPNRNSRIDPAAPSRRDNERPPTPKRNEPDHDQFFGEDDDWFDELSGMKGESLLESVHPYGAELGDDSAIAESFDDDEPPVQDGNGNRVFKPEAPDDSDEVQPAPALEGRRVERTRYEPVRDSTLRERAIRLHGNRCCVCGFQFDDVYGPALAQGYIEVHHLNDIANGERMTDPSTDLAPVCSNCHAMADRLDSRPRTIAELRAALLRQKSV